MPGGRKNVESMKLGGRSTEVSTKYDNREKGRKE